MPNILPELDILPEVDDPAMPARPRSFRLVTICNDTTAHDGTLDKLLDSVAAQGVDTRIWLRCHGVNPRRVAKLREHPLIAHVMDVRSVRPLSEARNAILRVALEGAHKNDIIAFPDDDCWYAERTLSAVARLFAASKSVDFVLGRISADPQTANPLIRVKPVDLWTGIHAPRSGAMFVRARAFGMLQAEDGYHFDTRFGLGATAGAAEEVDLILRLMRLEATGLIAADLAIGHPDKPWRPAQYWRGNLALLAKHFGSQEGDFFLFRRLLLRQGRGLRYVLTGALSPYAYASATWLMLRALRWDRVPPPGIMLHK